MNKERLESPEKHSKFWSKVIFIIYAFLIFAIIAGFQTYKYKHTFTADKWHANLEDRYKIISNMLERHPIIGMTESDIIELLGEEDSEQSSFKLSSQIFAPESTLVYYLGVDFMDNNWLIISIENGVAVSYYIDVT